MQVIVQELHTRVGDLEVPQSGIACIFDIMTYTQKRAVSEIDSKHIIHIRTIPMEAGT